MKKTENKYYTDSYEINRALSNFRSLKAVAFTLLFVIIIFLLQNVFFQVSENREKENICFVTYAIAITVCIFYILIASIYYQQKKIGVLKLLSIFFIHFNMSVFIILNAGKLTDSDSLLIYSTGIIILSYIYIMKHFFRILFIIFFSSAMSYIIVTIKPFETDSVILIFQVFCYSSLALLLGILNSMNHKKIHYAEFNSLEKEKNYEKTQRKIQRDLSLAVQVQQKLFPEKPQNLKNFDIALYHRSTTGISGDFYDFYIRDDVLRGVSLFDVSGHGIAAGLLTMLAKPLIYRNITNNENLPLSQVMKKIDADLSVELHGMYQFLTGILLRFEDNNVQYVNAAHTSIIYYSASDCKLTAITPDESETGNTILGVDFINLDFTEIQFEIAKGDFIIYFTDGLIDIQNSDHQHYSMKKFMKLLKSLDFSGSAQELMNGIIKGISSFSGSSIPEDDITVIAIKKL